MNICLINGRKIRNEAKDLFKNDVNLKFLKPFTMVANIMFKLSKIKMKS